MSIANASSPSHSSSLPPRDALSSLLLATLRLLHSLTPTRTPHPFQNIRYCDDALEIDPLNPKAYFRRSAGYEAKRDFDKALLDAKKAQELMDTEDKVRPSSEQSPWGVCDSYVCSLIVCLSKCLLSVMLSVVRVRWALRTKCVSDPSIV